MKFLSNLNAILNEIRAGKIIAQDENDDTINAMTTAGYEMGTSTSTSTLTGTKAIMKYNATTESIEFIFN